MTIAPLFPLIDCEVVISELFVWFVNKAALQVIHCWFVLAEAFSVILSGNCKNIVSTTPWGRNKTPQLAEEKLYAFCSAAFHVHASFFPPLNYTDSLSACCSVQGNSR